MNLDFCPNKKSKEFLEMVSALGGEDKAYFFWMRNKGNHLEKAPNGANSKLFHDLLEYFNGNRVEALKAKAKVYTNEFFNWFGDWIGIDYSVESAKLAALDTFNEGEAYAAELEVLRNIVELNGENITFDQARSIFDAIRKLAVIDEKVPGTTNADKTKIVREAFKNKLDEKTYFAVDVKEDIQFDLPKDEVDAKIEFYKLKKQHPELNLKLESFENIDKQYFDLLDEFISLAKTSDFFQSIYDLVDYVKKITDELQSRKNVSKVVDENGEPLVVWHSSKKYFETFSKEFGGSETGARDSKDLFFFMEDKEGSSWYASDRLHSDFRHSAVDPTGILSSIQHLLFGPEPKEEKITENVGGRQYKRSIFVYDDLLYNTQDAKNYGMDPEFDLYAISLWKSGVVRYDTMFGKPQLVYYKNDEWFCGLPTEMLMQLEKDIHEPKNLKHAISLFNKVNAYLQNLHDSYDIDAGAYLDTNPLLFQDLKKYFVRPFFLNIKNIEDASSVNVGNVKTSIVDYISHKDKDGFIIKNTYDSALQKSKTNVYAVRDSNQIKHVENLGTWDLKNNNVYYHIDKKVSGIGNLLDEIPKEGATTQQVVNNVVDFLKNKFVGLDINIYNDVSDIPQLNDDDKRVSAILYSNKSIKSMVYHGKVYIIQSRLLKQGGQIASEEILHMLVKTLLEDNSALFQQLLKEAKRTFKKLTKEIESTYKSLGQETINNEIVTQALARFVNRDIQQHRHSKFADLVELFVEWLKGIVRNAAEKIGNTVYINPTLLKNLTLQELSDLINAEDTRFDINTSSNSTFYNLSDNSSMNSILESNDQEELLKKSTGDNAHLKVIAINTAINNTREAFVQRQVEKYLIANEDASAADIYGVRIGSSVDWDEAAVKRIISELQEKMAKVFGLEKKLLPNGQFVYTSSDKSKDSKLRVCFVNSITGNDWTDDDGVVHRGMFEEGTKGEEAAWNAIYLSLESGDATTFTHEMAHYYIRTFWESQPVQEALKEIDKTIGKKDGEEDKLYSKRLEEKLVNWLTDLTMKDSEKKVSFWSKINKILHSIGKQINEDQNTRNNILDSLHAAFSINQDLANRAADIIYFEKYIGPVHEDEMKKLSDEVDEIDGTTFWKIKATLEAREKSERSRNKSNNYDLLNVRAHLLKIQKRSITNKDDISATVSDFLLLAAQDIERAIGILSDIMLRGKDGIRNLDVDDFMHLKTDVVGYYDTMLSGTIDDYIRNSKNISQDVKDLLLQQKDNIRPNIDILKGAFDRILNQYVDSKIEQYAEELVTVGDKDLFIANMKLWARNLIGGGKLMFLENALGPAVISRSPIVRLVEYLVTAQNRISYESALKVGHELIDKYKKCASIGKKVMSINFMKLFCELDDDGNPTGYFARLWNYGKLYKKRDEIINRLIKKYNLSYDEESNQIQFKDNDQYAKYMEDFYNEMDKIANFRYRKEYYIARAKILSPKALEKLRRIQRQIDTLLAKAMDKDLGVPMLFNLSSEEINLLEDLRKEKQNLANPYVFVYNADGSIAHMEEKAGEDLEIAKQFIRWNSYKSGKVRFKSNFTKFNEVRKKIVEKYGDNSYQVKLFDYRYKVRKISPAFYDLLLGSELTDELKELYARRNAIVASIMPRNGYYLPNLKKLNKEAFRELKRLDESISSAWGRVPDEQISNTNNFSLIATRPYVGEYDENGKLTVNSAYNYFIEKERAERLASGESVLDESEYTYTSGSGNTQVLSVFKYTKPNNENMIEDVLLGEYLELDLDSELVNTQFDASLNEELLPKKTDEFKNKNWEIIQKDAKLKAFYDAILLTMEEAYSMLPNFDASKMKYIMPLMRDRDAKLMFRNRHLLSNMGASIADAFSIVETDTKYNETFSQRADGSLVETIPIRWVSKMKDPSIICTDIVKSVTLFYEMALNYKNKAEVNPMLLAMLFQTQGGYSAQAVEGGRTEQAQRIEKFLLMYVYGRTRTGFDSKKPMDKRAKAISQITDTILSKAHAKLMNHNWRAVIKNFIDSFLTDMGEILAGKYITVKDAMWANAEMGRELFDTARSFGRANNKSKIAALMQLNGCAGTISEIFGQHNETWLRRIVSKHFSMGEYTLVDYTFKGHLTASLYHSIRLVKNPTTKELEYMTKDQAMFHYHAAGLPMKDGVKAWKSAKITLFDAYDVDEKGNAVVKDKYKKYVFPTIKSTGRESRRLVNLVHGIIRERSSVINGILDLSGNAAWKLNVAGALILLMRGWMITLMWDNLKDGHDFAEYESQWRQIIDNQKDTISTSGPGASTKNPNVDGLERKIVNEDPEYHGQYNFETGTIETGQWRGLRTAYRHGMSDLIHRLCAFYKHSRVLESSKTLTRNERYKLRRLNTMAATFIIVCGMTYITTLIKVKWPDEDTIINKIVKTVLEILNAANVSVVSERASQIPFLSWAAGLDIVNALFISKTLFEDADVFVHLIQDLIEMCEDKVFGIDGDFKYNKDVKSGAYKDLSNIKRDAIKAESYVFPDFSIDNVFRSISKSGNDASINYYIQNVTPTKQAVGIAESIVPWILSPTGLDVEMPDKASSKSGASGRGSRKSGKSTSRNF